MVNRLIIAAAGSGKTTYLVRQAMQQSDSVLITTYTIANELEIRKKIVELNGFVPHNVTIQCIFRKNCASVPEERSAIPLQTEQSSAG